MPDHVLGQMTCLLAALLWACAVTRFRRPIEEYGAMAINLAKCCLAAVFFAATVQFLGSWSALTGAPHGELGALCLSGLLGLVLGDTALFVSVSRLGVHRALLLQTLAPVFTAVMAFGVTGERLALHQVAGGLIVLAGIALVVAPDNGSKGFRVATFGVVAGVLSAIGQGAGVLLAKMGMVTVPVLEATTFRMIVAVVGLMVVVTVRRGLVRFWTAMRDGGNLGRVVPATLAGSYVAMFLAMVGISMAPASVAAVLLSTTPVFSLIVGAVIERRIPSTRGIFGTLLAVFGVAVLTMK